MAKKFLYIVWQDSFIQDEPIIDEQHRGVLASINSLHYFLQQGQGLEVLMPTVKICLSYMMFHSKTEEGILRAADYPELESYIKSNERLVDDFKKVCREALSNKEPELVLKFLKRWWIDHMALHEEITPRLLDRAGEFCRV
jgi:hemerythrin